MARTDAERVRQQRIERLAHGWQEVRVWVASDDAAAKIRDLAEKSRKHAEIEFLNRLPVELEKMDPRRVGSIVTAILEQGSPAYNTPSGPVLELLSELSRNQAIREISIAYAIFANARPGNARFVAESIPGKINVHYFSQYVSSEDFVRWERSNSDWQAKIKSAVSDPDKFEAVVQDMLNGMI